MMQLQRYLVYYVSAHIHVRLVFRRISIICLIRDL